MSKAWVTVTFVLWTAVMIIIAPYLFSWQRETVVKTEIPLLPGIRAFEYTFITKQPVLDWSGRLASHQSEITFDGEIIFSSIPGHPALNWSSDLLDGYSASIDSSGNPVLHKE